MKSPATAPYAHSDAPVPFHRGNTLAAVSVVMGALFFIPTFGAIGAFIGAIALKRSRNPAIGGRRAAVTGVILGLIVTIFQLAMGAGLAQAYTTQQRAKPVVALNSQFIQLLGSGNLSAARGLCTDNMPPDRITAAAEHLYDLGVITKPNAWFGGAVKSKDVIVVEASLLSETHNEAFVGTWVRQGDRWKLDDYSYRPLDIDPSTRPAVGKR